MIYQGDMPRIYENHMATFHNPVSSGPATSQQPHTYTPRAPSRPDILVADDEVPIADVIAEMLSDEGYSVCVVHDGASALLAIEQLHPKLALLDVAMPAMSGGELLEHLRREGFTDLPIILMSANSRLNEFLEHGATAVIPKPFPLETLLDFVERYTCEQRERTA